MIEKTMSDAGPIETGNNSVDAETEAIDRTRAAIARWWYLAAFSNSLRMRPDFTGGAMTLPGTVTFADNPSEGARERSAE